MPGVIALSEVARIIATDRLRTVYQPIVDLRSGAVVAHEALTRGPQGSRLERPDRLFDAAREQHLAAELDRRCLQLAVRRATAAGLPTTTALFVNVEPRTLDADALHDLDDQGRLVCVELTERDLLARPSDLLQTVAAARRHGWAIALDDVGADPRSLAMLPIVQPDVVKLDLALVQHGPTRHAAVVAAAVQAEAERSGMLVLAEGIETAEHLEFARSLGASLGQGWLFGRPEPTFDATATAVSPTPIRLRLDARPVPEATPGQLVAQHELGLATKPLLARLSRHLEEHAEMAGDQAVVLGTFQHARYFTPGTRRRYEQLAARAAVVGAFGQELPLEPGDGVRGGVLDRDDPLVDEWDVVVISPHVAAALIAVDLGDVGPEDDRRFAYLVTYDRDVVEDLARALLVRLWPEMRNATCPAATAAAPPPVPAAPAAPTPDPAPAGRVRAVDASSATRLAATDEDRDRDRDELTGLYRRSLLLDDLREAIDVGHPAVLFRVDLDGFRAVNRQLGHRCGDDVLRQVGARLRTGLVTGARAYRVDGDEIALLVPVAPPDPAAVALRVHQEVLGLVTRPVRVGDAEVRLSARIGVAALRPGDDPDEVLCRAEDDLARRPHVCDAGAVLAERRVAQPATSARNATSTMTRLPSATTVRSGA